MVEDLLRELVEASFRGSVRLRLAVTAEEYQALREHLLRHDGAFYGRLRNIPLIIESDPTSVPLVFETAI